MKINTSGASNSAVALINKATVNAAYDVAKAAMLAAKGDHNTWMAGMAIRCNCTGFGTAMRPTALFPDLHALRAAVAACRDQGSRDLFGKAVAA